MSRAKPKARKGAVTVSGPGKQVAVHKTAEPVTFMGFLDRASQNPNFDRDTFKAILDAKERDDARNAKLAYDAAMALAQAEMQPIRADLKNKSTSSKYASYPALDRAIRPIYSRHGFALSFDTGDAPQPDMVRVLCDVTCAGHAEHKKIDMPADGKGAKGGDVMTKTHATGSAVTYGMRYLLKMIFNLVVTSAEDDDGNAAAAKQASPDSSVSGSITPAQLKTIQGHIADTGLAATKVLDYVAKLSGQEVSTVADIPAKHYADVIAAFAEFKAKNKK